ncbi:MAG: hypothetical protein ABFS32_20735, partial [Bacteroidota bacterium]
MKIFITVCLIAFLWPATRLVAEPYEAKSDSSKWTIEIPLWIPAGFHGYYKWGIIEVDGSGDNDHSGSGILDKIFNSNTGLDYYFVGKLKYSHEKWQLQADVFGGSIVNSVQFMFQDGSIIDTKIATLMPRVLVGYQVLDKAFKQANAGRVNANIYAGARLFEVDILSKPPFPVPLVVLSSTWVNPVVGSSLGYHIGRFSFSSQFDIGLIDIFSYPTWWLQNSVRYRIGKSFS